MRQWRTTPALRSVSLRILTRRHNSLRCRWFSSQHHVETVAVPCASSGSIDVNLHNLSQHHPSHPLVICLPPFFQTGHTSPSPLPAFLKSYPSAVINYRWLDPSFNGHGPVGNDESSSSLFQWPTPIHDTLFGYSWILANLCPPGDEKRDIYVYGSYLGASLATSLALTESHQDQRMAVRGLLTYNGIYNWTMFLPDHPIHQRKSLADAFDDSSYAEGSFHHYLRSNLPVLFPSPSALFDPFASPSLFFRDAGLWAPEDFTTAATASPMTRTIDALSSASASEGDDTDSAASSTTTWNLKHPRKSYLTFPPWASSLKIPPALLLHESPPPRPGARKRKTAAAPKTSRGRKGANTFAGQAVELGELMRRSVERYELGEREEGGEGGGEGTEGEAERRVQTRDVGAVEGDGSLGEVGQGVAGAWLGERIGRDVGGG
ncbi:hypothetical protein CONLIGDRAFT_85386 [Coniochaeta ligniaria NRRL 30616]|uniref:Alpha/beta-hydrolase n=1 Tax=Coniochaeta ligniaria NRRL 30616 TaxID=1408157 RepID=A0A1J7IBZ1_9PEZI|nr:hypothetical protein CONLIGDRAFT_85386 [Coniochaeta ligniaria NRRL 30616]